MKLHQKEIFKRNFQFILFITLSVFFALTMILNLRILIAERSPVLIAIDSNGARIVRENSDPIYKSEAIGFIQKFLFHTYNFNAENFMQRLGFATALMSDQLWKIKKQEILSLKEKIERDEITIDGKIEKLTKNDDTYFALVSVKEKSRMSSKVHQIEIKLKLNAVSRSQDNPSGLEVAEYDEVTHNL